MDFEEFLWGNGVKKETIEYIKECYLGLKQIDEYLKTNSLTKVLTIQKAIVESCLLDIIKYASTSDKQKIINTFNSIPIQLSKENKKFQYAEIATRHNKLMYFERKRKLEIDFVLNINGEATAIEIKSGNNKQAKSLNSIISNYKTVTRYMKFEKDCNVYKDNKNIEHYPLFMIMFV